MPLLSLLPMARTGTKQVSLPEDVYKEIEEFADAAGFEQPARALRALWKVYKADFYDRYVDRAPVVAQCPKNDQLLKILSFVTEALASLVQMQAFGANQQQKSANLVQKPGKGENQAEDAPGESN